MLDASILAFGMPGGIEWVIVLVVALLIFGRRLPEVMRGLGGGMREFRKGLEEGPTEKQQPAVPPAQQPSQVEQQQSAASAASAEAAPASEAKDASAS